MNEIQEVYSHDGTVTVESETEIEHRIAERVVDKFTHICQHVDIDITACARCRNPMQDYGRLTYQPFAILSILIQHGENGIEFSCNPLPRIHIRSSLES